MDPYATEYEDQEEKGRNMPDYSAFQQQMQKEALRQKQLQLELALQQKYMEEELIEEELKNLPSTVQQHQTSKGVKYVQQVTLPQQMPDDKTYMYSSVMGGDVSAKSQNFIIFWSWGKICVRMTKMVDWEKMTYMA